MRVAVPGVCSKSLLLLVVLIVARAAGQERKCVVHALSNKSLSMVHWLEMRLLLTSGGVSLFSLCTISFSVSIERKGERGSNAKTYVHCINFCILYTDLYVFFVFLE